VVAPLHYQDRVIGTLELGSPEPDDLDATHLPKIHELLPLFAMAVRRSMDEFNSRIQTEIKERFTAIHPVVEWRFRKAVLDGLERTGDPGAAELQPIVLRERVPALRTVRHPRLVDPARAGDPGRPARPAGPSRWMSWTPRTRRAGCRAGPAPLPDRPARRADSRGRRRRRRGGHHLVPARGGGVALRASRGRSATPYARRSRRTARASTRGSVPSTASAACSKRASRASATRSPRIFDLEEQAAQDIFPHYFEKQKTDGVDHQIYVGGSLVEDGRFDPIYLKSLRLWQLMVVCGIAARATG